MKLVAGWATDVGHARAEKTNEDSYLVDDHLALFAVADGMGGHRGGEVASTVAIEALRAAYARGEAIDTAVRSANAAVYERSGTDPSLRGMGTTMTALIPLGDNQIVIAHAGDSRAYLARGTSLQRITNDHSVVEELVRAGRITPEQAAVHPQRNIITRALGVDDEIDVDMYTLTIRNADRILICSDGLTTMVRETDIVAALNPSSDPQASAQQLVDRALENGGDDNVTVIVMDISEVPDTLESEGGDGGDARLSDQSVHESLYPPASGSVDARAVIVGPGGASEDEPRPDQLGLRVDEDDPTFIDKSDTSILTNQQDQSEVPEPLRVRPTLRAIRYVLVATIPFVIMFAIAYAWLRHENDRHWYVGVHDTHIALYQGSRDAPLGWEPQIRAEDSSALVSRITEQVVRERILANHLCASTNRGKATACYEQAVQDAKHTATPSNSSSTSTSTSTSAVSNPTITTALSGKPQTTTTVPVAPAP